MLKFIQLMRKLKTILIITKGSIDFTTYYAKLIKFKDFIIFQPFLV